MTDARPPDPVPIEQWGKDHWSTLGYIGTRCVDHKGALDHARMRTDPDRHPGLGHFLYTPTEKYPTRLKNGILLPDHDDWDCLYDMEALGLIELKGTGIEPIVKFTEKGQVILAALTNHKMAGGTFSNFTPNLEAQ